MQRKKFIKEPAHRTMPTGDVTQAEVLLFTRLKRFRAVKILPTSFEGF